MDQPPIGWSVYGYAAHRCELAASIWLDVAVNKVGHAGPKPYADPMWSPSPHRRRAGADAGQRDRRSATSVPFIFPSTSRQPRP